MALQSLAMKSFEKDSGSYNSWIEAPLTDESPNILVHDDSRSPLVKVHISDEGDKDPNAFDTPPLNTVTSDAPLNIQNPLLLKPRYLESDDPLKTTEPHDDLEDKERQLDDQHSKASTSRSERHELLSCFHVESIQAKIVEMFSFFMIMLSLTSFCLETLPQYRLRTIGKPS